MFSEAQQTDTEILIYTYFADLEPVQEEEKTPSFFMCVYEENSVYYCASTTQNGVYWYTYCLNNPLIYTDPSGEFIFSLFLPGVGTVLDAMCWGAVINGGFYTAGQLIKHGNLEQWDFNQFAKAAAVGAISGAAGAGAGLLSQSLQVYGALPGALIEGGIQGTSGAISGGIGNVIMEGGWGENGQNFWQGAKQGFATGFLLGGISGGVEGFKNAKSIGANPWSGKLISNQVPYTSNLKSGISLQPNPERDCYGYALEYADDGHGNRPASYFLGKANNSPGAYAGDVARKSGIKVNWSRKISGGEWDSVGGSLLKGKEILATTSSDGVKHWVNITSVTTADRWRIIGGGWKRVLQSTSVWDPITGHVTNGPISFYSVLSLF